MKVVFSDLAPELSRAAKRRGLATHWRQLQARPAECDTRIERHVRQDERCVRTRQIPGVGALTADALVAAIGDSQEFRHGRQLSTWIGPTR